MFKLNKQAADPYAEIREIRKHLRPVGVPTRELSNFLGRIRISKNTHELNNATEAKKWKPVTQRVRSIISRSGFRTHCPGNRGSNSDHRKPSTGNRLSQHCEVLGPYHCSECIKYAYRNKYNETISESFPSVTVNERKLCKHALGHPLSLTSVSLPALNYGVTKVSNLSDKTTGAMEINKGQESMTRTELQQRVMARHRHRISDVWKSESSTDLTKDFSKQRKRTRFLEPDL